MARARNIKPGFFLNDLLAEIEPLGRLLFAGLWTIADREGRLEDRPKKIKAAVLPYDDCDVDYLLNELEKRDFIIRYEANGEKYIQITKWEKHQNPHYKEAKSEIPPYPNNKSSKKQTKNKVAVKAKKEHSNVESTLSQHQTKLESTLNQHQVKLGSSSHADSFNLIPDSLNPIITISEGEPSSFENSPDNDQDFEVIVKSLYRKLKDIGIKKSNNWYNQQIGIAKNLLVKYPVDEICSVIDWAFTDSFYRKSFNSLAQFENALQAMKGGADNGRTRTSQKPDRRPLTAEDYDEPEYRDLIRASDRKLEKLGVFKVPSGN